LITYVTLLTRPRVAAAPDRVGYVKVWIAHEEGRELLGDVPAGAEIEVLDNPDDPPSDPATVEFWTPAFLSTAEATHFVPRLTGLRVAQLLSAGAEVWTGRFGPQVTLCDARGVHDSSTSEWAVTAILSYLRDFPFFAREQAARRWSRQSTDELAGKRVLIVGAGAIGAAIARRLEPFEVPVTMVARRARPGVHSVDELPTLLPEADIVVLIVPLTEATTGMVDAKFLAALHDGALLVNAARGPIVDTAAVTAELATGRIGYATDVTEPEPLPADHPLWTMPNVLLTPHVGGAVPGFLKRAYKLVGEQLHRYTAGQPLENIVTDGY
jgi:phosphoglycerate dehydrogenase-like enzyme